MAPATITANGCSALALGAPGALRKKSVILIRRLGEEKLAPDQPCHSNGMPASSPRSTQVSGRSPCPCRPPSYESSTLLHPLTCPHCPGSLKSTARALTVWVCLTAPEYADSMRAKSSSPFHQHTPVAWHSASTSQSAKGQIQPTAEGARKWCWGRGRRGNGKKQSSKREESV